MTNRRLGNLGNLGDIIPSFLISEFSILAVGQNQKPEFKNLDKKISEVSEFSTWSFLFIIFLFIYLKLYLKSVFTVVKKLIYIDNKKT